MSFKSKFFLGLLLLLALATSVFALVAPKQIDQSMNKVAPHDPWPVSAEAATLHSSLTIMDWHTDSLLWQRNFLEHNDYGHVDLQRLQQGNVALTMLTTVTKSPDGLNLDHNDSEARDNITALAVVQGWPPRTWNSLLQRALYQGEKLVTLVEESQGELLFIRNQSDLNQLLKLRAVSSQGEVKPVGVLLGTEGAHPLEGDLKNIDVLWAAGFRMMSLQHFFDNKLGGSLHGSTKSGLTEFGADVIKRFNEIGMIIDVSHSSEQVIEDVLAISKTPLVISHTGIYGTCESARNLPDALMQKIAAKGGLIAVGYWPEAICDSSPKGIAATIKYAIDLLGIEHVALGSDFDGTVTTTLDTSELAAITHELKAQGVSDSDIAKVMGGNSVEYLQRWLPQE